jgi:hypothetical protein
MTPAAIPGAAGFGQSGGLKIVEKAGHSPGLNKQGALAGHTLVVAGSAARPESDRRVIPQL